MRIPVPKLHFWVCKKNPSVLGNLKQFITETFAPNGLEGPLLIIDDEADNASINTQAPKQKITRINGLIRDILNAGHKTQYLGYTATPFANVFIEPECDQENDGYSDLFPEDFVFALSPPDSYVGPHNLFNPAEESEGLFEQCVVDIDNLETSSNWPGGRYTDNIELKHKSDFYVNSLPDSLVDSIRCFAIALAIRIRRGNGDRHHSMMINVSRFNSVQERVETLTIEALAKLRAALNNKGSAEDYNKSPELKELYRCFNFLRIWHGSKFF